ncbi:MAG: hypothetical protein QM734_09375 [Cyclobacteriaceae bacterium]
MKRMVLLIASSIIVTSASAQFNFSLKNPNRQPKTSNKSNQSDQSQSGRKFYFGGGGGLGAGTDPGGNRYIYYSLLPIFGYQIDDNVSVGATITYQKYSYPSVGASYTQYGLGPFVRYTIDPIFFQAEYDLINSPTYGGSSNNEIVRTNYSRFLVGIGYVVPLGSRSRINAMAMYDLLYQTPSVFLTPFVVRVFFVF